MSRKSSSNRISRPDSLRGLVLRVLGIRSHPVVRLVIVGVIGGALLYPGVAARIDVDPGASDARADWLTTKAFYDGVNPYQDIDALSVEYGVPFDDALDGDSEIHPRTPGALLLQWPMTLFSARDAERLVLGLGALSLLVAVMWLVLILEIGDAAVVMISIVLFGFAPMRWNMEFYAQSAQHALLATAAIHAFRRKNDLAAGGLVALLATFRLFPGILLLPALRWRRWRLVSLVGGVLLALNLVPLLLPHVAIKDVVAGMSSATENWFSFGPNISIAGVLDGWTPLGGIAVLLVQTALVGLAVLAAWYLPGGSSGATTAIVFGLALLGSPLAWPHYLLIMAPFVLWAFADSWLTWPGVIAALAAFTLYPIQPPERFTVALVMIIAAMVFMALVVDRKSPEPTLQQRRFMPIDN